MFLLNKKFIFSGLFTGTMLLRTVAQIFCDQLEIDIWDIREIKKYCIFIHCTIIMSNNNEYDNAMYVPQCSICTIVQYNYVLQCSV